MITPAAVVSAANPWTGSSFVILKPIVLTILQPPNRVPRAIAELAMIATQRGTLNFERFPVETRRAVTTPMVFWASLLPWARLTRLDESIWSLLK